MTESIRFRVSTTTNPDEDTILQVTETLFNGHWERLSNELCVLKDQQIREALIKLGWTPPKGT